METMVRVVAASMSHVDVGVPKREVQWIDLCDHTLDNNNSSNRRRRRTRSSRYITQIRYSS